MEAKRYTVFVSSTYTDLKDERREVMQALLELDCIPVGMELFPAADDTAWDFIKQAINTCDYYLVIIGGRYGSVDDETQLSYTEKEYDYAVEQDIPVIAFTHERPDQIPAGKCEAKEAAQAKLQAFRERVQTRLCKGWSTAQELGGVVSRSLFQLIKQKPAVGWVRGDQLASADQLAENARLRGEVDRLQGELSRLATEAPKGTEALSQGTERIPLKMVFFACDDQQMQNVRAGYRKTMSQYQADLPFTWDQAFGVVGPLLLNETDEQSMSSALNEAIPRFVSAGSWYHQHLGEHPSISATDFQNIKLQFVALGYIVKGEKRRAIRDTLGYWRLTPFGENYLMRLKAIRRPAEAAGKDGPVPAPTPVDAGS